MWLSGFNKSFFTLRDILETLSLSKRRQISFRNGDSASTFLFMVLERFKPRAFLMFKLDPLASSSRFDPCDMLFHSCQLILKSQFGESEFNNDVDERLSLLEKVKPDFNVISSCFFFAAYGLLFSIAFFVVW